MTRFESYMEGLYDNFDILLNESLESVNTKEDGKKGWTWEYDGIKYRAKVAKIGSVYDFMFGPDRGDGIIVTGDTHAGQPMRAFAGALDALKKFIKRDNPKTWKYSGIYTREKLYDKFSKRIEKETQYKMYNKYNDEFMIYYQFKIG